MHVYTVVCVVESNTHNTHTAACNLKKYAIVNPFLRSDVLPSGFNLQESKAHCIYNRLILSSLEVEICCTIFSLFLEAMHPANDIPRQNSEADLPNWLNNGDRPLISDSEAAPEITAVNRSQNQPIAYTRDSGDSLQKFSKHSIFNSVLIVILATVVGYLLRESSSTTRLFSQLEELSASVSVLQRTEASLRIENEEFRDDMYLFFNDTANNLIEVNRTLHILYNTVHMMNKTSNSAVLIAMGVLRGDVAQELSDTHASVQEALAATQRNLTKLMERTEHDIALVQANMSAALIAVQQTMSRSNATLNAAVLSAKASIETEVAEVNKHMDQYIVITNKQFTAENDFVKYQLAGEFYL
jgi:hypothetical protein